MMDELVFYLNYRKVRIKQPDPEMTLLTYLREEQLLKGTKCGCGEGGCGACTILLTKFCESSVKHFTINSCLALLTSLHGVAITTVEGVGSLKEDNVHPVQSILASSHGTQCGFCTPGFVMSMFGLVCNVPRPQLSDIEEAFQGNLCRCTGYRPILQGYALFSKGVECNGIDLQKLASLKEETEEYDCQELCFWSKRVTWYRPKTLDRLLELKNKHPNAMLVVGNTEVGIENKFRKIRYPVLIATSHIACMTLVEVIENGVKKKAEKIGKEKRCDRVGGIKGVGGLKVGVSCSLSEMEEALKKEVDGRAEHQVRFLKAMLQMLKMFASRQIRNVASLGGNVMTASPISDLNPLLLCARCPISVLSLQGGVITKRIDESFFTGYRTTALKQDVLLDITLPYSSQRQYFSCFKTSRRREDDISIVNAAMTVTFEKNRHDVIEDLRLVYGGLSATVVVAMKTRDVLVGKRWNEEGLKRAMGVLRGELKVAQGSPGGMEAYRSSLATSFFFKFFTEVAAHLELQHPASSDNYSFLSSNISSIHSNFNNINNKFNNINNNFNKTNKNINILIQKLNNNNKNNNDDVINNNHNDFNNNISNNPIKVDQSHYMNGYHQDENEKTDVGNNNCSINMKKNNKENNKINYDKTYTRPTFFQVFEDAEGNDVIISSDITSSQMITNNDEDGKYPSSSTIANSITITNDHDVNTASMSTSPTTAATTAATITTTTMSNTTTRSSLTTTASTTDTSIATTPAIPATKVVRHAIQHLSALKHTTGEAVYTDDIFPFKNELFLTLVQSTKSRARILKINFEEALEMDGVVGMVDFKDVKGVNEYAKGEFAFMEAEVTSQGQALAGLLSLSKFQGQMAVAKVKVEYEELKPIITIPEAIEASSFFSGLPFYSSGQPKEAMQLCDHVLEGEVSIGGQEHFYMETNVCIVVPREDGGCHVTSNSQNPPQMQEISAKVLGVESNRVETQIVRLGGGFGGKETRTAMVVVACVVAAGKFGRPVRCVLERNEDMMMTGGRHPYYSKYKVGFNNDSNIKSLIVDLFSNCGFSPDLSPYVMIRAMLQSSGSYEVANIRINLKLCHTNLPSNTAFRGFGNPQGIFVAENIIEHISDFFNLSPHLVREVNMYKVGDVTPYEQIWTSDNLRKCWRQVKQQCNYEALLQEVDEFNKSNRWKKRGVCMLPSSFGLGYDYKAMMMGAALVNIMKDGSVVVYNGGVEMGQGLHTKLAQVAAEVLRIPVSRIRMAANDATVVPNTMPTSASLSSDLHGMAVMLACKELMRRMKGVMEASPDKDWNQWVLMAMFQRINLSATGYYKVPGLEYDEEKFKGALYCYFTVGAACSIVEIDCLTGNHWLLRSDIVMDVGKSLNPAIDIGQIEGAFIQGYGLMTIEDVKYSPNGRLLTQGPGAYKIPSMNDVPRNFNVTILKGSSNEKAVYSSKGVGEPPLLLATSVFFAIKHAIQAARKHSNITNKAFRLDAPATCERIRMACVDEITEMYDEKPSKDCKAWFADV